MIFSIVGSVSGESIASSTTISAADFLVGLPSLISEIEVFIFTLVFHYAYSAGLYKLTPAQLNDGQRYHRLGFRLVSFPSLISYLLACRSTRAFCVVQLCACVYAATQPDIDESR